MYVRVCGANRCDYHFCMKYVLPRLLNPVMSVWMGRCGWGVTGMPVEEGGVRVDGMWMHV